MGTTHVTVTIRNPADTNRYWEDIDSWRDRRSASALARISYLLDTNIMVKPLMVKPAVRSML